MNESDPPLAEAVAEAMGTFDALCAWYLDRVEGRVVTVRDGVTSDPELSVAAVEDDEERFVEIPAVVAADEHEWLGAFQEEHGAHWPHIRLDNRAGAVRRFLKALSKNHPEAIRTWEGFRSERLRQVAADWLADRSRAG